jgi:hypothetical protein
MKTTSAVKAQNTTSVWQRTGKTESILNQVRKITRELHAVQNELYRELSEEDGTRRQESLLRQAPACDDLKGLQTAADQLRRVLWFYLDLESQERACDTVQNDSAIPEEWLRQDSRHEPALSEQRASEHRAMEAGSFFERLNLVIDGYMQDRDLSRNEKAKKP